MGSMDLAEVYVRCQKQGYRRSFESMCRQIRQRIYKKVYKYKKSFPSYRRMEGEYPGDKVQIDIKYIPDECIRFFCYGVRYY